MPALINFTREEMATLLAFLDGTLGADIDDELRRVLAKLERALSAVLYPYQEDKPC